jgi:hypothetical protein
MASKISPAKSAACGNPVLLKDLNWRERPESLIDPEQEGLGCYG